MLESGPSSHLSWAELACHDEAQTPYPHWWVDRALVLASEFEALRESCSRILDHDASIRVISGYRTPARNAAVGGAGASQHVLGRALDLAPPAGLDLTGFAAVILNQALRRGIIRGIGIYRKDGHVHFDVRLEAKLARWEG